MIVDDLKKGQYTFGIYDHQLLSGAEEITLAAGVRMYPNPASQILYLELEPGHNCCFVEIMDLSGKRVLKSKIKGNSSMHSLDVSELPVGSYNARVSTEDGVQHLGKFVVVR